MRNARTQFYMKSGIYTYTKIQFDTLNPQPEDIRIQDIAHALSMLTRANGHFPQFFSVGQHSIQCCREAMERNYVPQVALACLLHDASEAYISDITRPVKKDMTMYLQIEEQLQTMIYEKFLGEVPKGEAEALVDNIDDGCLYYEFNHFMDMELFPAAPFMVSNLNYDFKPMQEVEQEFLELFGQLSAEIRG